MLGLFLFTNVLKLGDFFLELCDLFVERHVVVLDIRDVHGVRSLLDIDGCHLIVQRFFAVRVQALLLFKCIQILFEFGDLSFKIRGIGLHLSHFSGHRGCLFAQVRHSVCDSCLVGLNGSQSFL